MVQLLTNGLVLQLLSIQFIWRRSKVDRKYRQMSRTAATTRSQKQEDKERQMEAEYREER